MLRLLRLHNAFDGSGAGADRARARRGRRFDGGFVPVHGIRAGDAVEVAPFLEAFLVLIVIPDPRVVDPGMGPRKPAGQQFAEAAGALMVPLMMATLLIVGASQVPKSGHNLADVLRVAPFYVLFLIVMGGAGLPVSRLFRLDAADGTAIVFTGATRVSLVVLPWPWPWPRHPGARRSRDRRPNPPKSSEWSPESAPSHDCCRGTYLHQSPTDSGDCTPAAARRTMVDTGSARRSNQVRTCSSSSRVTSSSSGPCARPTCASVRIRSTMCG